MFCNVVVVIIIDEEDKGFNDENLGVMMVFVGVFVSIFYFLFFENCCCCGFWYGFESIFFSGFIRSFLCVSSEYVSCLYYFLAGCCCCWLLLVFVLSFLNLQFLRLTFKRLRERFDFLFKPSLRTLSPCKKRKRNGKKAGLEKNLNNEI